HVARLEPADDLDEHTITRQETAITVIREDAVGPAGRGRAHLGDVSVANQVVGYQRRRTSTRAVIEHVPLDFPPRGPGPRACWFTLPHGDLAGAGVRLDRIVGAVHAAEHALIGLLPLFAICDRWDVGGVSMAVHPQTGTATIFVYDGYPGGAGIAD